MPSVRLGVYSNARARPHPLSVWFISEFTEPVSLQSCVSAVSLILIQERAYYSLL